MNIITIIPAFNEEDSIGLLITLCKRYTDHVIVVDDGSTDKTREASLQSGAQVISHPQTLGVGAAIKTGYKHAMEIAEPKDILVNLDGDGQHDPHDIPRLIHPIRKGEADLVVGSRFLNRPKLLFHPIIRGLGNYFFSFLISLLCRKTQITDSQSGFRVIQADKMQYIELENDFTNRQEMILKACRLGLKIKEVPIAIKPRKFGSSFLGTIKNKVKFFLVVFKVILTTIKPENL